MGILQTAIVSANPVSLADAKAWCTVEASNTAQDGVFTMLLAGARADVERITGLAFGTVTWLLTLDCWADCIDLPRGPVSEITSVKYLDGLGVETLLSPATYMLDMTSHPQRILRDPLHAWPSHYSRPAAISITFKTVMDPAIIDDLKLAILMIVAARYEDRTGADIPAGAMQILRRRRDVNV